MWVQADIEVQTRGRSFVEITGQAAARVHDAGVSTGLCHLFLRHTSASLCVTENADPTVRADLERFARHMAPDGHPMFHHVTEGDDDMPAHVRTLFAGYELTVPVRAGRLALGTWQGIFVWEHRYDGHRREVVVTINGQA
jgi:secondary thiamine-phosphate synthase enzyme